MEVEPDRMRSKRGVALLGTGCVLLTCGAALLIYAWTARFTAIRFLDEGVATVATVRSIERRGTKHGGVRVEVAFWDRTGGPPVGILKFAELTDLMPLRFAGVKEGDEIEIRWFAEAGRLRVAPEASLNAETRPPEFQFAFGIGLGASGGVLLGCLALREARQRERPGEMR